MKKISYSVIVAVVLFLASGCAGSPPQAELDAAKAALESAVTAQAADYAPEAFAAAQEANAKLEEELKKQKEASGMSRSYTEASKLAAEVKAAAEKAATDAQSGKETMKEQVTAELTATRTGLADARTALAKPSKMKAADMAKLKADLDAADGDLTEAETASTSEHYKEAMAKVVTAKAAIDSVHAALMPAPKPR